MSDLIFLTDILDQYSVYTKLLIIQNTKVLFGMDVAINKEIVNNICNRMLVRKQIIIKSMRLLALFK